MTIWTRTNRVTGSKISLIKNSGPSRDYSWTLKCETHNHAWSAANWTRADAEAEATYPDAWCEDCSAGLDWEDQGWMASDYEAPER